MLKNIESNSGNYLRLFSQTLLPLESKEADCLCFHVEIGLNIFEKRATKINTNAQNSFFYVKIGL